MNHKQSLYREALTTFPMVMALLLCCVAFIGCPEGTEMVEDVIQPTPPAMTGEVTHASDFQPCLTIDTDDFTIFIPEHENWAIKHGVNIIGKVWTAHHTVDPSDGGQSGVVLTVKFLDGTSRERDRVRQVAPEWTKHGAALQFKFVESGPSDIRVGFDSAGGNWSRVGTDATLIPPHEKTMNLANVLSAWEPVPLPPGGKLIPMNSNVDRTIVTGGSEGDRTILHEFGHALSLKHEHQSPAAGIRWNRDKVLEAFRARGLSDKEIEDNVLRRLSRGWTNYTTFDPQSIMIYWIHKDWTLDGYSVGFNTTLSSTDKAFIRNLYPLPPPDRMVLIPQAGQTLMGSGDTLIEERHHWVLIDAFYMDKYEVTNAEYAVFLNAKGKHAEDGQTWLDIGAGGVRIEYVAGTYRVKAGYENHPVVEVSWYGAMAYAAWAGKRLPTEAEWEKAARGFWRWIKYPWKHDGHNIDSSRANYNNHVGDTQPVGSYSVASPYGVYDMAGNVSEWCLDEYNRDFYHVSPKWNPLAGAVSIQWLLDTYTDVTSSRVLRGGSFAGSAEDVRFDKRHHAPPTTTNNRTGFRCARDPSPIDTNFR